jgi:hypothetical protein
MGSMAELWGKAALPGVERHRTEPCPSRTRRPAGRRGMALVGAIELDADIALARRTCQPMVVASLEVNGIRSGRASTPRATDPGSLGGALARSSRPTLNGPGGRSGTVCRCRQP